MSRPVSRGERLLQASLKRNKKLQRQKECVDNVKIYSRKSNLKKNVKIVTNLENTSGLPVSVDSENDFQLKESEEDYLITEPPFHFSEILNFENVNLDDIPSVDYFHVPPVDGQNNNENFNVVPNKSEKSENEVILKPIEDFFPTAKDFLDLISLNVDEESFSDAIDDNFEENFSDDNDDNFEMSLSRPTDNDETLEENMSSDDHDDAFENDRNNCGKNPRRKKKDPERWARNVNKKKRMHGKSYKGVIRDETGKTKQTKDKNAKKIDPICNSNACRRSEKRKCHELKEEDRLELFNAFWQMDWGQKKTYLSTLVECKIKERERIRSKNEFSNRVYTFEYFLKMNKPPPNCEENIKLQVCLKTFSATFGIKPSTIHRWIKESRHGMVRSPAEKKYESKINQSNKTKEDNSRKFLNELPKLPSHYCRKDSSKLYLENTIPNAAKLYDLFISWCEEQSVEIPSRWLLMQVFNELNLAFYIPKKDQCDVCCAFKTKNITEEEYLLHQSKKEKARNEKEKDKAAASDQQVVLTMDMQAVLLAPKLNASAVYYKTKLCCHNFTLYNLKSRDVMCFFWHEGQGGLTGDVFATCVYNHLLQNEECSRANQITIYSDGCGYQNRNVTLANALLHFSEGERKTITQKFLTKGHTQMEVDSAHSLVERKIKGKEIYTPAGYISAIKEARPSKPFEVQELQHTFFIDFDLKDAGYRSIRPGHKSGDPLLIDVVALQYRPEGNIYYKIDFDNDWEILPARRGTGRRGVNLKPLYQSCPKIKATKYHHLQQLKKVLPSDCHDFYDNLEHYSEQVSS